MLAIVDDLIGCSDLVDFGFGSAKLVSVLREASLVLGDLDLDLLAFRISFMTYSSLGVRFLDSKSKSSSE